MDIAFFLKSKRFWSMPVGSLVTWLVANVPAVAEALEAMETTPDELAAKVTLLIVWLVGMTMGKRGLTVNPKKEKRHA